MKRLVPARTKGQNEVLVMHVLEELSKGFCLKEVSVKYKIPWNTLTSIFKRYRMRHGFKNTYHMLSVYIVLRETKKLKKLTK